MIVAYYVGAFGPTLRIDIQTQNDLEAAITIFEGLAQSSVREVNFAKTLGARLGGPEGSHAEGLHKPKHVQKVSTHDRKPTLHWLEPVETWERCIGLVEVFRTGEPGHQHLTPENVGDALVEFAFREERPPGE